ncbi:hypothetical protein PTKU46_78090 [Paraburkholderia terrae]
MAAVAAKSLPHLFKLVFPLHLEFLRAKNAADGCRAMVRRARTVDARERRKSDSGTLRVFRRARDDRSDANPITIEPKISWCRKPLPELPATGAPAVGRASILLKTIANP